MDIPTESTISPTRTAMTIGAVTAGLMAVFMMIPALGILSLAIFIGGIYYGMKRNQADAGGKADYIKVTMAGIRTAFFASLILAFCIYVLTKVIDPSLIDASIAAWEQMLQKSDIPKGVIESNIQEMQETATPGTLAFAAVFLYTLIGSVIACFCGLFLKKDNQPTNRP